MFSSRYIVNRHLVLRQSARRSNIQFSTTLRRSTTTNPKDQSTGSSKWGLTLLLGGSSLVVAASTSAVAYLYHYDDEMRKKIQNFTSDLLNGSVSAQESTETPSPSSIDETSDVKFKRSFNTVVSDKEDSSISVSAAIPPLPPIDVPVPAAKVVGNSMDDEKEKVERNEEYSVNEEASRYEQGTTNSKIEELNSKPILHEAPTQKVETESVTRKVEEDFDLPTELKRQAMIHADHLKDTLTAKEGEFNRKLLRKESEYSDKLFSFYSMFLSEMAGEAMATASVVQSRSDMLKLSHATQSLWISVQDLYSLTHNSMNHQNESDNIDIKANLNSIREASKSCVEILNTHACCEDEKEADFVNSILDTLPDNLTSISTEYSLRERFLKVERLANQTALVQDLDNSCLVQYMLSYLQNLLVIREWRSEKPSFPANNDPMDVSSLSVFDTTQLARGCVERGDFSQAVKYLNLLRGEPGRVSSSWIKDVTHLLEVRQACEAILSYSAFYAKQSTPFSGAATSS